MVWCKNWISENINQWQQDVNWAENQKKEPRSRNEVQIGFSSFDLPWRKKWCESRHMRTALLKQADVSKGRTVLTDSRIFHFKLSPCSEYCILSFGWFPASKFYVSKRRHIKFRCRGITQKKEYNIGIVTNLEIWDSHIRVAEDSCLWTGNSHQCLETEHFFITAAP